ncbi:serine/threonine protein kinase [Planctomicrobium piriforme]|uniref:Protein kinase domain-containing protein n=1 Tax=Planctomicrobium piriforme TaxID=1576369 RepID=A0A1I3MTG5_9PLAN|nr:serine/threonine-protein kinase [Planctomicrobium piriforme]SFJ00267.1 hypothetical protein/serine/threonine protein kinase [Planctomicrobium piriforme]
MNFLRRLFQGSGPAKVDIEKRFRLQNPVGQGTMSKVWKATDTKTGQTVALKILDKEKTKRLEQRFVGLNRPREGVIAISLHHPHVVQTYDHGITTKDEQFLVMEFIEGVGLSSLVDLQGERMTANCLRWCIQLGEALDYVHSQQWIHRDLCPRNIIITMSNQLKLIDFGLMVPNTPPFRKPGNRTGTAMYMAPELVRRLPTDQRIDVFSYAVTCYQMFTKQFPWPAADTMEAVMQHVNMPPKEILLLKPDMNPQVAKAIMRGLEKEPADRWQSVKEMVEALRAAAVVRK